MDLLKLRLDFLDWVYLIQDKVKGGAFVNMIMNFRVPLSMRNFFSSLAKVSVSRRALLVEVICMFILLAIEKT